jgi:hypothetical protein
MRMSCVGRTQWGEKRDQKNKLRGRTHSIDDEYWGAVGATPLINPRNNIGGR